MFKKAIGPVVSVILLLLISVLVAATILNLSQNFVDQQTQDTEQSLFQRFQVMGNTQDSVSLNNPFLELQIESIIIDENECDLDFIDTTIFQGIVNLNLSSCIAMTNRVRPEILFFTDRGRFRGTLRLVEEELGTCQEGGIILQNLQSHRFFNRSQVDVGENCLDFSQVRTCENGVLNGSISFQFASCLEEQLEETVSSFFDCSTLPGDWIEVPGSSYFGTDDFCVMQFEAKAYNLAEEEVEARSSNDISGFIPYSSPDATPWVSIDFINAETACNNLNSDYSFDGTFRMITNRQWMTIARDAEQQDENWADNVVGSTVSEGGGLFRGNVNLNDAISCDHGSTLDGNTAGTNCVVSGGFHDGRNKRTLELSNGAVIWDVAGNVWQWVDLMENGSDFNGGACGDNGWHSFYQNDGVSECSFVSPFAKTGASDVRFEMGPEGNFNANNGVGRIWSQNSEGRVLVRGGGWVNVVVAGAFAARLLNAPGDANTVIGFRCAFEP